MPDVRRRLPMDLLPALRDAESDHSNWRRSPLRPLLDALSGEMNEETKESLANAVTEAAMAIAETEEVKKLGDKISNALEFLAGKPHSVPTTLSFSPSDADRLIRTLRKFIDNGLRSINEASLGSSNLIYLALTVTVLAAPSE